MAKQWTVSYAKTEPGRKTAWVIVGRAFEEPTEPPRIKIRLDATPMPAFWDGTLVLYPAKPKKDEEEE